MNINEIYIRNFGKLKDFRIVPTDRFNLIFGKNESGKSTLLAFIKQMLYGGRDRKLYFPKDGSPCGGTLDFQYSSKKYHLERTFGLSRKTDIISLKNADTGAVIPIPLKQEPGEWLFDLTEEAFINTIYIGQLSSVFDSSKIGGSVVTKLSNLNSTGDEQLSYVKTEDRLRRAMNSLSFRNKGKIHDLQDRIIELREEQNRLKISREIFQGKNKKINDLKIQKNELSRQKNNCLNYLKICEKKIFLQEFKEIDDLRLAVENQSNTNNYMIASGDRGFSETAKELYNECAKDIAIIKKCESDFKEQDDRYKGLAGEYEGINHIIGIDFANVEEVVNIINSSKNGLYSSDRKTSPIVLAGIVSSLVATAIFAILSMSQYLMLIPAIIFAVVAFAFSLIQYKNTQILPNQQDLTQAENDLFEILQHARCDSLEELLKKKADLDIFSSRISDIKDIRNKSQHNLDIAKEKLDEDQEKLFNWLSPIGNITNLSQAKEVIGRIDYNNQENISANMETTILSTKFETILAGRSFEALQQKAIETSTYLASIKNLNDFDESLLMQCKEELVDIDQKLDETIFELSRLEGEVSAISVDEKTPDSIEEEIKLIENKVKGYEDYYSVLDLAKDALFMANEEMGTSFAPDINNDAAKILSDITGGKYNDVRVSSNLEPVVFDKDTGLLMEKWSLSGGTIDQLYLALRLSVSSKIFYGKETLPLFLDEALSQYDDDRMVQTINYLTTLNQQILMFTCQGRELEVLKDSEIVNYIEI